MEQSFKTVHVDLLKVVVKSFSPIDNMAVLEKGHQMATSSKKRIATGGFATKYV